MATSRNFRSKINIFLIYVSKDSPCPCDHFHTKLFVVGWHLRRRNPKKHPKNAISVICFVASSMTSALGVIYHLKALDLNFDIPGRLSSATTWWRSRANWTKTLKSRYDSNMTHNIYNIHIIWLQILFLIQCCKNFWDSSTQNFQMIFSPKCVGGIKIPTSKFSVKFFVGQYVTIWGLYTVCIGFHGI